MTTSVHRKVGRPPIADAPLEQISVRLAPHEIERVTGISKRLGISRNEAFRVVLNDGLEVRQYPARTK